MWIVHRPGECTVDDELAWIMDDNNFVEGKNNSYNQYPNNFNQGQGLSQGVYRPQIIKIRVLNKKRYKLLFKKPCFNIWPRMIREWSWWSLNSPTYNTSYHKHSQETSFHNLNQILRERMPMLWWPETRGFKRTLRKGKIIFQILQMTLLLKRTKHLGKLRFILMRIQWQTRKVRRRYWYLLMVVFPSLKDWKTRARMDNFLDFLRCLKGWIIISPSLRQLLKCQSMTNI